MTGEPPRLKLSEDALEELIMTYTRHNSTATGQDRDRVRQQRHLVSAGPMGGTAAAERAACWLRIVSTVEIYAEALLKHLDGDTPGRTPGGWSDVTTFLQQRHGINLNDLSTWDRLNACFLVRNAVAHGLGRFTARQIEKAVPRKVRAIGVPSRDGMVVITEKALASCVDTCRTFITDLDAHPGIPR